MIMRRYTINKMVMTSTPTGKQNTKGDYEAADLMVTTAATIGQYNTVSLALQHQKAMVCVELPNSSYIFSNAGIDPYVLAKSENVQFSLNGTAVLPYFDESSQSYRFIVEPGQEGTLSVSFTNNGLERTYEVSGLSQMQRGQYAKYVIDGGALLVNTTLKVGDYYLADGRIVSKDTPVEQLPDNIIGIVFKLGTTDALRSANSSWSHGSWSALMKCAASGERTRRPTLNKMLQDGDIGIVITYWPIRVQPMPRL